MKIKALSGKIMQTAKALEEISGLDLQDCVNVANGNMAFPDEFFEDLCDALGNPDLYFKLV